MLHQEAPPETRVGANCSSGRDFTDPPTVLTMTAGVRITGPGGLTTVARALLDSGATNTLVSSSVVQTVQAKTAAHRTV